MCCFSGAIRMLFVTCLLDGMCKPLFPHHEMKRGHFVSGRRVNPLIQPSTMYGVVQLRQRRGRFS